MRCGRLSCFHWPGNGNCVFDLNPALKLLNSIPSSTECMVSLLFYALSVSRDTTAMAKPWIINASQNRLRQDHKIKPRPNLLFTPSVLYPLLKTSLLGGTLISSAIKGNKDEFTGWEEREKGTLQVEKKCKRKKYASAVGAHKGQWLSSALGNVLSAVSWWVKGEKRLSLHRPEPDIHEAEAIRLLSSAQQERKNRRVKSVCGQMFVNRLGTTAIATAERLKARNVSDLGEFLFFKWRQHLFKARWFIT